MGRLGPAAAPTLGVTAMLALLWLLAAAQAGPDGWAAAALDPGRAGSIGEWWGNVQLAVALAVAVFAPESRLSALVPAAVLAGEVGEVHIHVAHILATATGSEHYLSGFKVVATVALGAVAFGAALRARHRFCSSTLMGALVGLGAAAVLCDAVRAHGADSAWLAATEEWIELAVYSSVAYSILASTKTSHSGTLMPLPLGKRHI